ncbi:hypothetical protein [Streptosporangium roseum]|uniref:hypothetical protein n=1 Tax=Streptosporangium roseum TaxID=2001 RepID=UPI00332AD27B
MGAIAARMARSRSRRLFMSSSSRPYGFTWVQKSGDSARRTALARRRLQRLGVQPEELLKFGNRHFGPEPAIAGYLLIREEIYRHEIVAEIFPETFPGAWRRIDEFCVA